VEQALRLIQKRYHHEHPGVAYHALLVLEACVKNCGTKFKKVIATAEFMDDLKNIATRDAQDKVEQKVLELVQSWAMAFRDRPEYRIFVDTHGLMKTSGYQFPGIQEGDAMFAAECAPDLVDANNCYRCRVKFGRLTRKHHCRACRQTFCRKCSNKAFFPQFGVEKKLRVCKMCFDERQKEDAQTTKDTRVLAEEHDEEWHLELTISHSKAEVEVHSNETNQTATATVFAATARPPRPPPPRSPQPPPRPPPPAA
ncbi:HGF-regulated tyrosine kinase substrate, partial [Aphelenchoides avenae]